MVTFVNGCVNHMRKRKIIMCCLLLAMVIPYVFSIIIDGVFNISDLLGEQPNIVFLAACVISGLAAVVWIMMLGNRDAWFNFAQAVKEGRVKGTKLSYLGTDSDVSKKTDYNIPMSEFWELDVAVENNNHFIEHAVLRCKVQEKTDISRPEINIVSKTISIPYGFDKTELEKMKIDINSLQEVVGK